MILLDTHILIWWFEDPRKLSDVALKTVEKAIKNHDVYVSSISIWEIYMLVQRGKLHLKIEVDDWIERVEGLPFMNFLPIDNEIASLSVKIGQNMHADPADRFLVATARRLGVAIVTADVKLRNFSGVETIW